MYCNLDVFVLPMSCFRCCSLSFLCLTLAVVCLFSKIASPRARALIYCNLDIFVLPVSCFHCCLFLEVSMEWRSVLQAQYLCSFYLSCFVLLLLLLSSLLFLLFSILLVIILHLNIIIIIIMNVTYKCNSSSCVC